MCLLCRILLTIHVEFWGRTPFCSRPPMGLVYSLPDRADTLHLSCTSRQDVFGDVSAAMSNFEGACASSTTPVSSCMSSSHLTCVPFFKFCHSCALLQHYPESEPVLPSLTKASSLQSPHRHCRYRLVFRLTQSLLLVNRVAAPSRIGRARVILARPHHSCV